MRARKRRAIEEQTPVLSLFDKNAGPQRVQKILAAAGYGSRRQCEDLVREQRVTINGNIVLELGACASIHYDQIEVDGERVKLPKPAYYAVNKPAKFVCTNSDPAGRPKVVNLVPQRPDENLFTVGRLDLGSEGLILVTSDGELANRLTHPRYEVAKVYQVQVAGIPERETLQQLREGVRLAEGFARVEGVHIKKKHKASAILEMTLKEGKNREIRRIFAKVGHKVVRLTRIAVGPVRLGTLPAGEYRVLTPDEVAGLYGAASQQGR